MTEKDKPACWTVNTSKVDKDLKKLPKIIRMLAATLFKEIENTGPFRKNWKGYGPLKKEKKNIPDDAYHCHLKQSKPYYVACWNIVDKKQKFVRIFYVGTHENAPY